MAIRLACAFLLLLVAALMGKPIERKPAAPLPAGVTCKNAVTMTVANDLAGSTAEVTIHAIAEGGTRPMCWCSDDYVRGCQ